MEDFHHLADLTILSLMEYHAEPCFILFRVIAEHFDFTGRSHTAVNLYTLFHLLCQFFRKLPANYHFIFLLHFMAGMGQNKIKLSVIGHQKEPFRMVIQSSHGKYTFPHTAEIIHNRSSSRRIGNRSNHTIRLME